MKTLRLLLFEKCNRSCAGCCNKQWDLTKLPRENNWMKYDQIILTGGEPMLRPDLIMDVVKDIRSMSYAQVLLYTAKVNRINDALDVLASVDGMTLTLHEQKDVKHFVKFQEALHEYNAHRLWKKSLRLNVFSEVDMEDVDTEGWQVKENIEWIEDCPLPDNEVFMRL